METITRASWLLLAAVHVLPAAMLFAPQGLERLYGAAAVGTPGLLLQHRGALFLAVVLACAFAAFDAPARRVASLVVAVSVVGFLLVYARAGWPPGPLRTIALADAAALLPLAWVAHAAWSAGWTTGWIARNP